MFSFQLHHMPACSSAAPFDEAPPSRYAFKLSHHTPVPLNGIGAAKTPVLHFCQIPGPKKSTPSHIRQNTMMLSLLPNTVMVVVYDGEMVATRGTLFHEKEKVCRLAQRPPCHSTIAGRDDQAHMLSITFG